MTGATETLDFLDVDPALRPLARAMAVRGPRWSTVLLMELRKTVDTRGGRWVLVAVLALAVGTMAYELLDARTVAADPSAVTFARYLDATFTGVALLLPVVGVLTMTSEWSRRAAVSTFTLVPRRGRVLSAKVVATLVVVVAAALVCSLVALVATSFGAQAAGVPIVLDGALSAGVETLATTILTTLVALGVGALVGSTRLAVVAFSALPIVSALAARRVLGDGSVWLDGSGAIERVAEGSVTSWTQTGTALGVWLAFPLVAGVVRSLRREVA